MLDPGVTRVVDSALAQLPDGLAGRFRDGDREGFERDLAEALPGSADLRFAAVKTPEPFGPAATLYEGLAGPRPRWTWRRWRGAVACPTLVCDPDDAEAWAGQSKEVAAALGGPVTVERFTAEDGASLDCEILAPQVRNQRVYDWLADVYPRSGS